MGPSATHSPKSVDRQESLDIAISRIKVLLRQHESQLPFLRTVMRGAPLRCTG